MPKFKFRLATLLRLRESARDERRAQLAQAYRADELLAEKKRILEEHLADMRRRTRLAASPGEIDVDRLLEARRFETVLLAQKEHVGNQQEMIRIEIERRRQALVAANREVRILENLRARQHGRHQAEENRQETKQLDEAARLRALREDRP
jgi:flagellar export protein FliJ